MPSLSLLWVFNKLVTLLTKTVCVVGSKSRMVSPELESELQSRLFVSGQREIRSYTGDSCDRAMRCGLWENFIGGIGVSILAMVLSIFPNCSLSTDSCVRDSNKILREGLYN